VREVFMLANEKAPAIIFIDELDAVGSHRLDIATSGDREVQRTLMQLLSELDGFSKRGKVAIIGATNRPDILDPALLRPGRFDRIIEFEIPDSDSQIEIFKIHTRAMKLHDDVKFKFLVDNKKLTGADIKAICTEAGMFAIREAIEKASVQGRELVDVLKDKETCVRQAHLLEAKAKVQARQGERKHENLYI
ncbi:AAA family ATPase, partial [Candidatus Thorarchaeota archaeon]